MDLRLAELLASRLCHDVVGPIGAVNNGMELLTDGELDMADDALKLASHSAQQAADLLQYYRMAYGLAGHRQGGDLRPMHDLAVRYFGHQKASLDWSASAMPTGLPDSAGKLILNMLLLAGEALPRGGTVGVLFAEDGGVHEIAVVAVGADAGLREETQAGLADDVPTAELTPRSVQPYFTKQLARAMDGRLDVETPGPGHLRLTAKLPA
ncbi:MAG: histidine phosphotransferase family protein [Kiloniellales bacterium]|nr:histidine phosphotransferase family protein [Kiloniellales bacterium]